MVRELPSAARFSRYRMRSSSPASALPVTSNPERYRYRAYNNWGRVYVDKACAPDGVDGHSKLSVDCLPELMCQTRAGESGSWLGIAPSEDNALATALAIRPPIGMIGPSPAPLTPSGLLGDRWFSSAIARIFGKSVAVGIR